MAGESLAVAYRRPSELVGSLLSLQTAGLHPRFFTGFLTAARPAAVCLTVLADVAAADFRPEYTGYLRDPVVTCGGDRLRFEVLSGCCGVYARLDVLPEALDGEIHARGTTNVDINPELYRALSRIGGKDPLRLSVGPDDLTVTTLDAHIVEKKVPLPSRWLRGLAEAGFIASGLDPRAELTGAAAASLLQRMPPRPNRDVRWLVPAGRSVRLATGATPAAVCLPGPHRVAVLRPLLPMTRLVRLYGPPATPGSPPFPSGWELELPGVRFSLLLSPGVDRGLSGEGALLTRLDEAEQLADRLGWDGTVDPDLIAQANGMTTEQVRGALAALAMSGKVGYDWADAAYFHRELPLRPELIADLNPRLVAARALVAAGAVHPGPAGTSVGDYLVHETAGGELGCTCRWWVEHRGTRGPCKHVLAVTLTRAVRLTGKEDT
ncbi:SWIM zinc finger family protein [Actinoplanes sp. L3-i22]|uniref:SWIM zinc finger family protein n=1 Tax=Actinoplanes sp. L3-i22 TaxID=2836373 RepID=UPI001C77566D|nr:SWIM zinc finger family protein [Actinoplanes sp. L3-i22]BCY08866.1 hypothetical protein L3i22_039540 [Actinoplanes sp. L3-i22]